MTRSISPSTVHGRKSHGFTLLELLVAMAIFSVMAVLAYRGTFSLLHGRDTLVQRHQALADLQMGFHLLRQDLEQIISHPLFQPGDLETPALAGGAHFLEFTRGGYLSPSQLTAQSCRRIRYQFADGVLSRAVVQVNTSTDEAVATSSPLLDGLTGVAFRFLDRNSTWQERWDETNRDMPPLAVEITLEKNGWGRLRRLFRTGA